VNDDALPAGYDRQLVPLADGREVEVLISGAPEVGDLVFLPGTPSGTVPVPAIDDVITGAGFRLVQISRPGYGLSTADPGRSVAKTVGDVGEVLDALGVDRFVVAGISGGGPYALGCGALLAPRCVAVADISGVAPYDADGLDWLAGMGKENVDEFNAAVEGGAAYEELLETWRQYALVASDVDELAATISDLLCEADGAALREHFGEAFLAGGRRAALTGVEGLRDDELAFVGPWGFLVEDVAVPVSVWHGTEDRMVPVSHARWIAAHAPEATVEILDGEGHLSIVPLVLDRLLAGLTAALA
jgi:pimeloyl-ACP methyl ester carboxylesterase